MGTVYILGAGASHNLNLRVNNIDVGYGTYNYKDFTVKGPLSKGYFYYFNQLLKTLKENIPFCSAVMAKDLRDMQDKFHLREKQEAKKPVTICSKG